MKTNIKTAVAYIHEHDWGIGTFEDVLRARGFDIQTILTPQHDPLDLDPLAPDLLLVMGGPMGVYEADSHPYLNTEIKHIESRIAAGRPVLGVCLGAQLMAAALGARVYKSHKGQEIGWLPLTLTSAGQAHEIKHFAADGASLFHWHGDTFDLPSGAVHLARSAMTENQAFSYGANALGLQFHPEITTAQIEDVLRDKAESAKLEALGVKPHRLASQTLEHAENLRRRTADFLNEWLDNKGI